MMDWTDDLNSAFHINSLGLPENPCHLYGTTNFSGSWLITLGDSQRTPRQQVRAQRCAYRVSG
jgi:hypothetical protein